MQIRKRPYDIDYAGNSPEFVLRAEPYSQHGRCWTGTYRVDSMPAGTLVFSSMRIGGIPGTSQLEWTVTSDPDDSLYQMQLVSSGADAILDSLEAKVVYNPALREYFDVTAWVESSACYIKFTSLIPEPDPVTFYHDTDASAVVWTQGLTGAKRVSKPNYRVRTFFTGNAGGERFRTPDMYMEESDGDVIVSCSLLRSYFPKPDIPVWGEYFEATPCTAATITARLWYGEMYAADTGSEPVMETLDRSPEITLLNGTVSQYAADNNIPDWTACNDDHLHLKAGVDILGMDNNETVVVPKGSEQYIYIYNYSLINLVVRVQVAASFADGTYDDDYVDENLTVVPGVNRIAVSDADAVSWAVTLYEQTFNRTITRTYVTREYEYGTHTFLMLNALNLYESFPVEYVSRDEQTEGERRIIAGTDSYGTTDRQTVYTAKCQPRNARGLRLLKSAFASQDNLMLDGTYAWYVDIIPGSVTVSDESADLMEVQFQFRLREKVSRDRQQLSTFDITASSTQVMRTDTVFK